MRITARKQPKVSGPARRFPAMDMKLELVPSRSPTSIAPRPSTRPARVPRRPRYQVSETLRFVQLTPPGSACSIVIGEGVTEMTPGSHLGLHMVIADEEAARKELSAVACR